MNNKNNKSTTNVCGNKKNNRNYENINKILMTTIMI